MAFGNAKQADVQAKPYPYFIALVLFVLLVAAWLALRDWNSLVSRGVTVDGIPMVTNNDGYYHLSQARRIAAEGFQPANLAGSLHESLLLPSLLSVLAGQNELALLSCSIWLGPILGLTMVLAALPWAWQTRYKLMLLVVPLLGYLAPAWIDRTHLGSVDTDSLVPFGLYFSLFTLERFSVGARRRIFWLGGWASTVLLFWLWWKPGAFVCVGLVALWLAYIPRFREALPFKCVIGTLGIAVLALGMMGVSPFAVYWDYARDHMRLALSLGGDTLTRHAILELKGLSLAQLGDRSLGAWGLLPLVPVGGVLYIWDRRWNSLFLVAFGVASGFGSFYSNRFVPVFIPAATFFAAYALIRGGEMLLSALMKRSNVQIAWFRGVAGAVATAVLLGPAVWKAADTAPSSYFNAEDYALSQTVRSSFPPETMVWTWWDFGYFFQFFTGMRAFFDGGSQTDRTCFIAAYPLMQKDPQRASAWMRYFAVNSVNALPCELTGVAFDKAVEKLAVPDVHKGVPVALCLPSRVFKTVGYLYSFAHVFEETVPPVVNRLDLFAKEGLRDNPATNELFVPEPVLNKGYTRFGAVVNATGKSLAQAHLGTQPDPYLIYSAHADFLAITDRPVAHSVLFQLLGLFERNDDAFQTLRFDWREGGVWRVL